MLNCNEPIKHDRSFLQLHHNADIQYNSTPVPAIFLNHTFPKPKTQDLRDLEWI